MRLTETVAVKTAKGQSPPNLRQEFRGNGHNLIGEPSEGMDGGCSQARLPVSAFGFRSARDGDTGELTVA